MRKPVISLVLAGVLVLLAGPLAAGLVGHNDQQVQTVAEPILDNVLAGFNQGQYDLYARDFDEGMREAIPAAKFQQVRQELLQKFGEFKSKKFLGFLNQKPHTVVLWKASFAGTPDDVLIRLVLSQRQDKVMVSGLWFQAK